MVKHEINRAAHEKTIADLNRFRPEEWRIDTKAFTFRGQKVYLSRIGRYILEDGFDIYAEYHVSILVDL